LYQPVYNLVTKKIVGHEALLQGPNSEGPAEVLDVAIYGQGFLLGRPMEPERCVAAK
jgi:EAL domain-containing protein (putative c-di-GMP-specific phosphodiesterase class I)